MEKPLFEQMGGTYTRTGDYHLPALDLPAEKERHIGVWGQRHARYLKLNNKVLNMNLLTSGRLNEYLASVDALAVDMFFRLATEYSDRQGVTEQLKSKNQFLWIQKMNNILACVREVVENDIIYS